MIIGRAFLFYFIIFSHWACDNVTPLATEYPEFLEFFLRELCTLTQSLAKKEITYSLATHYSQRESRGYYDREV